MIGAPPKRRHNPDHLLTQKHAGNPKRRLGGRCIVGWQLHGQVSAQTFTPRPRQTPGTGLRVAAPQAPNEWPSAFRLDGKGSAPDRETRTHDHPARGAQTAGQCCPVARAADNAFLLDSRRTSLIGFPVDDARAHRVIAVARRGREALAGFIERENKHVGISAPASI
jgi:hypothetical protein